jgi:NAD(P)H-dependent FMN reductase
VLKNALDWASSPLHSKPEVCVFTAFERFDMNGRLVDQGTTSLLSGLLVALEAELHRSTPVPAAV